MSFDELCEYWQLFISVCCERDLTFSIDKLPLIQSVAAEVMTATGPGYIRYAGMWQHNLRKELLWFISC